MKYLIILLFIPLSLFSQSIILKGKIIYDIKTFGFPSTASLDFSSKSSLYYVLKKSVDPYVTNQDGNIVTSVVVDTTDSYIFVNKQIDTLYLKKAFSFESKKPVFNYLLEPTPKIEWEILYDSKKVANVPCKKAMTTFRGRTYTAWFAPSIPAQYGPW